MKVASEIWLILTCRRSFLHVAGRDPAVCVCTTAGHEGCENEERIQERKQSKWHSNETLLNHRRQLISSRGLTQRTNTFNGPHNGDSLWKWEEHPKAKVVWGKSSREIRELSYQLTASRYCQTICHNSHTAHKIWLVSRIRHITCIFFIRKNVTCIYICI